MTTIIKPELLEIHDAEFVDCIRVNQGKYYLKAYEVHQIINQQIRQKELIHEYEQKIKKYESFFKLLNEFLDLPEHKKEFKL